jgi:hypothetical protein
MSRATWYWRATPLAFFVLSLPGALGTPLITSATQSSAPTALLPCHGAWREDPSSRTKTLTADCVTEHAITVAEGWTFDGGGHTVHVVDPAGSRFRGGVIDIRGGAATVRNVAIEGSALAPGCSPQTAVAGVLFVAAAGSIEDTTIANIARGQGYRCGYGIIVADSGPAAVNVSGNAIQHPGDDGIVVTGAEAIVRGNTVADAGDNGIAFGGPGTSGTITGNAIRNAEYAGISVEDKATATITGNAVIDPREFGLIAFTGAIVQVTDQNRIVGGSAGIVVSDPGTSATIDGSEIADPVKDGIYVQNGAGATVLDNVITGSGGSGITVSQPGTRGTIRENVIEAAAVSGILVRDRAEADAIGNAVRGPGSQSVESLFGPFGIRYASGAAGEIRENSISGYRSDQPGSSACAIAIDLDAGDVRLGPNSFPEPGNASNVCIGTPPEGWNIPKPRATPAATPQQ